MQPASTPAPAQTGSNTNNLVLTSEERIRIRQRLFTKLLGKLYALQLSRSLLCVAARSDLNPRHSYVPNNR